MSSTKERIAYLLEAYTSMKATVQEERELMEWIQEAKADSELKEYIRQLWSQHESVPDFKYVNWNKMFDGVVGSDKVYSITPGSKRIRWPRIAAAASILLVVATGVYLLLLPKNSNQPVAVVQSQQTATDVAAPTSNKSTLTLGNGRVVVLDSTGTGSLATQGAASASKVNQDELVYNTSTSEVEYHTLNVPRGSRPMQLQLADGSEVWLNAASSITFPTIFTGDERRVSITGEAYFEVTKNSGKKFIVSTNGTSTEVLGTHFNVNAYGNEPSVRVTLLEGSVRVNGSVIKPGQQALTFNGHTEVKGNINMEEVMAWKNGLFEFNQTDIQTIMRQIERWYDVDVVFDGTVTQDFHGIIPRKVNVSKVLNMLEKTGGVRFYIEGKKVLVKNY